MSGMNKNWRKWIFQLDIGGFDGDYFSFWRRDHSQQTKTSSPKWAPHVPLVIRKRLWWQEKGKEKIHIKKGKKILLGGPFLITITKSTIQRKPVHDSFFFSKKIRRTFNRSKPHNHHLLPSTAANPPPTLPPQFFDSHYPPSSLPCRHTRSFTFNRLLFSAETTTNNLSSNLALFRQQPQRQQHRLLQAISDRAYQLTDDLLFVVWASQHGSRTNKVHSKKMHPYKTANTNLTTTSFDVGNLLHLVQDLIF